MEQPPQGPKKPAHRVFARLLGVRTPNGKNRTLSVKVELLNGSGSFDDPAWAERRARALTRLEATTDPVLLPGFRKLVRKWREEAARSQMTQRAWMNRPDRKAFDETG
ncbi:MAG TPA: hypothetical protein VGT81_19055 [Casimicrobiaceae bacterium]|nr:hypothetical protein [Casimicrobiaceae bacterium]